MSQIDTTQQIQLSLLSFLKRPSLPSFKVDILVTVQLLTLMDLKSSSEITLVIIGHN